jgi:hypothetical protein
MKIDTETPPELAMLDKPDIEPGASDFVSRSTYAGTTQLIYDDLDSEAGYNIFLIHIALPFISRIIFHDQNRT